MVGTGQQLFPGTGSGADHMTNKGSSIESARIARKGLNLILCGVHSERTSNHGMRVPTRSSGISSATKDESTKRGNILGQRRRHDGSGGASAGGPGGHPSPRGHTAAAIQQLRLGIGAWLKALATSESPKDQRNTPLPRCLELGAGREARQVSCPRTYIGSILTRAVF